MMSTHLSVFSGTHLTFPNPTHGFLFLKMLVLVLVFMLLPSFILFHPSHFFHFLSVGYLITPCAVSSFCPLLFCLICFFPSSFSIFLHLNFIPHFWCFLYRYLNKRCYSIPPSFCLWCIPRPSLLSYSSFSFSLIFLFLLPHCFL